MRTSVRWWMALLFATALTSVWAWSLPLGRVLRGQNDFLSLYAGATLAGTPDLYSIAAAERVQRAAANIWLPAVIYSRPPFYAALLRPLAALPYHAAYLLFQAINFAALAACFWFWLRGDPWLVIFGGISIPVVTAFANGQDVLLLVLIFFVAWDLYNRKKQFWSGLVFSLLAVKFHLFLLLPIVLVAQRRWRMLGGGAAGVAAMLGVSTMLQGSSWPVKYLHLLEMPQLTPVSITMPNLRGLLGVTLGESAAIEAVLAALTAIALCIAVVQIRELGPALALAVAGGLLVSHHAYVQDLCLLLLIPVLAPRFPWTRRITLAMLAPPAYFVLIAGGVVSALFPLGLVALFCAIAAEGLRDSEEFRSSSTLSRALTES